LPVESEAILVAALVGSEVNRSTVTLPGCVALITPAAKPVADAASRKAAVPARPEQAATRAPGDVPPPPPAGRPSTIYVAPFDDGSVLVRP
ncbi:hypothetical protein J8J40_27725, partial [Mycobacterium tuberculosis]|nr:hypothetical protein [Mycobacterium tuberculosis]